VVSLCSRLPAERKRSSVRTVAEINGGTVIWIRWSERQIMSSSALIVKSHLLLMAIRTESIVATSVISQTDLEVAVMTKEQMEKETMYQATMSIAKNLLNKGMISDEEYAQIDTNFRNKYGISLSTLFTDIHLIKYGNYGNM
jgi:uncharacterized membrane protein